MYYFTSLGTGQYLSLGCAEDTEEQKTPGDTELVSARWRYVASPDSAFCLRMYRRSYH